MNHAQNTSYISQEKSDMFVTSLDVFSRRAYFDPYTTSTDKNTPPAIPTTTKSVFDKFPGVGSSHDVRASGEAAENVPPFDESAVSKAKRFSSSSAFMAANLVIDYLQENLGGAVNAHACVGRDVLLERRRSFFDTLFTREEDLQTALSCRFSTTDVGDVFCSASDAPLGSTESYRKRLAALKDIRSTLDC
ncbi:hypothetical protein JKF63_03496 [Porcisia hertigi]|uniref:Uncharacterized protein n=1 Tax=Porcisia hertigi TaxID=2761500 RepID=A0A836L6Q9_9TRYP|nr:hypothetical protein JKF63_03496 [Porcisia hertigi]